MEILQENKILKEDNFSLSKRKDSALTLLWKYDTLWEYWQTFIYIDRICEIIIDKIILTEQKSPSPIWIWWLKRADIVELKILLADKLYDTFFDNIKEFLKRKWVL